MLPSPSTPSDNSSISFSVSLPSLFSSVSNEFSSNERSSLSARSFLSTGPLSQRSRPSNPTPQSALLSSFSPQLKRFNSNNNNNASETVQNGLLSASCFGCWKFYDSVHHLPKIFTTCLHTTCSQCICDVSNGQSALCCPIGNCPVIQLAEDNCQTMMNEINNLPTNIPALVNSLTIRILSGNAICDGPFCCETDHTSKPCSNKAISLFRPKSLLVCADCFAYGMKIKLFDNCTNQPLDSLVCNESWLKVYLKESRQLFAECPTHPNKCIKFYCRTCHLGICDDCLPQHQISMNTNGSVDYFLHNVKYFDHQVLDNEIGFFRSYCKLMKMDVDVLTLLSRLLNTFLTLWRSSSDRNVDARSASFSLEILLNEVRVIKGDFERLIALVLDGIAQCSAPELCSLRQWVRVRAYPLHVRTTVLRNQMENLQGSFTGGNSNSNNNINGPVPAIAILAGNGTVDDKDVDETGKQQADEEPSNQTNQILLKIETECQDNNNKGSAKKEEMSVVKRSNSRDSLAVSLSSEVPSLSVSPVVETFSRHRLYFSAKIGQAGDAIGQFSEPSGLTVTANNNLVVVDSNAHRVQMFSLMDGKVVTAFGRSTTAETSLFFPNRIAVSPKTGFFYITERAPLRLVQIFDTSYRFVRRFGVDEVQHPRAICCDYDGNVIILQGLVMTVTIYSADGDKLKHFKCLSADGDTSSVSFPTAMCVSKNKEIFIADNTKHSIFVYSYEGELRRIICPGKEYVHYPIGLSLNHRDELVVCDNHETFNVTLFRQDGTPIRGFQSQVKHSGVFDCCLVNDGRAVAMSCRDFKVYIYQYEMPNGQPPPMRRYGDTALAVPRNRSKKNQQRITLKLIDTNQK